MFSTNAFSQASFSINAFKQSQVAPGDCKFWANGFWSQGYWSNGFWCDGAKPIDAKSGYWRLFYYQMQEEALNKQHTPKPQQKDPVIRLVRAPKPRLRKQGKVVAYPQTSAKPQLNRVNRVFAQPQGSTEEQPNYLVLLWQLTDTLRFTLAPTHAIVALSTTERQDYAEETSLLLLLAA